MSTSNNLFQFFGPLRVRDSKINVQITIFSRNYYIFFLESLAPKPLVFTVNISNVFLFIFVFINPYNF